MMPRLDMMLKAPELLRGSSQDGRQWVTTMFDKSPKGELWDPFQMAIHDIHGF